MQPTAEAVAAYMQQIKVWQEQYGEFATCPVTGLQIPKTFASNLAWRKRLRETAMKSEAHRASIRAACASSYMYWVNAFGWTYHQKWVNSDGREVVVKGDDCHVPFITWKIQDDSALQLISCITRGEDALIDKSRDMGASWEVISVFHWLWQFQSNSTFLEVSRKELYVDQRGNMDSLFEKHRYLLRMQPVWLRPKKVRDNTMLLENQDNGSTIVGESTNDDAGQGGRKTAILLDEFARMRNGEEIDLATADTSACRIFNSTVNGPATWYTRIYRELKSGVRKGVIITLPWEAHPEKGRGLTVIDVPVSPNNPLGKKAISPWYIHEQATRSSRDLAQNVDRDHGKSGDSFFDGQEIELHRASFQQDPLTTGNLRYVDDLTEDEKRGVLIGKQIEAIAFVPGGVRCSWKIWCPLVNGRPVQSHSYVFGVDISMGTGSSNSVISVFDHDTNMKVAEFADPFTTPEELAWQVSMAAVWFGGETGLPLLVWETNGPGGIFGKKIVTMGYPNIYYSRIEGRKVTKRTERYGWNSTAARKEILLGEYRDALKNVRYINPSKDSLDEALDYVYDDTGLLVPATAKQERGGAAATHGDRVVADALCELGRRDLPSIAPKVPVAPKNSYAGRREEHRLRMRSDREAWSR